MKPRELRKSQSREKAEIHRTLELWIWDVLASILFFEPSARFDTNTNKDLLNEDVRHFFIHACSKWIIDLSEKECFNEYNDLVNT